MRSCTARPSIRENTMLTRKLTAALLLFAVGAAPAWADTYDKLAAAIKAGDSAQVKAMLDAGLSPAVAGSPTQSPPLVLAVVTKQHGIARQLLAKGAAPDARHATYYNATALMLAVNNRDQDMVRLLLEAGAKVNLTDKAGDSALNWATFYGDAAIADILLAHKIDATLFGHGNALDVALRRGHQQLVERYVDYLGKRQPVAAKNQPLFEAVAAGDGVALKAALAAGAVPGARDSTGRTALSLAARRGDVNMARALLDEGADINATDPIGFTALMEAARDGKADVAVLLLDRKADLRLRAAASGLELTALHLATASGQKELVKLLVQRGADINARDTELATPLLWAINQQPEVAVLLLTLGANPDLAPKEGDSPRTIAEKRKLTAVLEVLPKAS
jgi:ankyrin repeat protein